MDSHYFLSKSELLGWINDTLSLRISKVEDTASGAVACQLMDALHPGVVPMKKIDFNSKNECVVSLFDDTFLACMTVVWVPGTT